jgi:hypothetical protein
VHHQQGTGRCKPHLSYRPLAEDEFNIINIEDDKTSCFIGRTEPVSVCFGYGTADEISVLLKDGFLVNHHLEQLDFSLASMPVRL